MLDGLTAWIITDGKAGDLAQAEGLAMALGTIASRHDIAPRPLWSLAAPFGSPDPRDDPRRRTGPLPDLAIGAGRRAAPAIRALTRMAGARPFTVFLKNPRIGLGMADLVWTPDHDRTSGPNVVTSLTGPHRFSAARLDAIRQAPPSALIALPRPVLGIVLGGPAGATRWERDDIARLEADLRLGLAGVASVVATPSRRTSPDLAEAVRRATAGAPGLFWDGAGDNPFAPLLALSDALLVTGDSHNMVSEALATGAPVHVARPSRLDRKIAWFLDEAERIGLLRRFEGVIHLDRQAPVDATPALAAAVECAYSIFRRRVTPRLLR